MEIPWKEIFKPDCGMLLEIRVYKTSEHDYQALLGMLVSHYNAKYVRDGVEQSDMPDYRVIDEDNDQISVLVRFFVAGVRIHVWFGDDAQMNLDLLPEDIDSPEKAKGIFQLMREISGLLDKRVLLTMENASADQKWSEQHAICSINPGDAAVTYHGI